MESPYRRHLNLEKLVHADRRIIGIVECDMEDRDFITRGEQVTAERICAGIFAACLAVAVSVHGTSALARQAGYQAAQQQAAEVIQRTFDRPAVNMSDWIWFDIKRYHNERINSLGHPRGFGASEAGAR